MELRASNGVRLTKGLFYEWGQNHEAPYTLKLEDMLDSKGKVKHKSIYKIYMDSADEYEAAIRIVGCIDHWRKLCESDWFMNGFPLGAGENMSRLNGGLVQWRKDMLQRDESTAKRMLLDMAKDGNISAAKYIHEISTKGTKGRPATKTTKDNKPVKIASLQEAFKKAQG